MFKQYFINENKDTKQTADKKVAKISKNFEEELRKYFKIKEVTYNAFGMQIDFFKKVTKEELQAVLDPKVKIKHKDRSVFIEF